jgi:hypothetical protein
MERESVLVLERYFDDITVQLIALRKRMTR